MSIDASEAVCDKDQVRSRLIASFAVAVALGFAWGPAAAAADLLRFAKPDVFFSPSRYLCLTTAVSVILGLMVAVVGLLLVELTLRAWRSEGRKAQRTWAFAAFLAWVVLVLYRHELLPLPEYVIPAQEFIVNGLLGACLVWCVGSVFFYVRAVQLAILPSMCLPFLLLLIDVSSLPALLGVGALIVGAMRRYESDLRPVFADISGMMAFVALPLAGFVHVMVGHFVPVLDGAYSVAFVGIFVLCVAALLGARNTCSGRSLMWPAALVALSCVLIVAGGVWSQHPPSPPAQALAAHERPNITLIVWDTARAGSLGHYGGEKGLTPVFDKLASRGVLFERATATSCWTLPTHASMMTGLWVRTHAATYGGYPQLAEDYDTIAEILAESGYQTLGLTANHHYAGRLAGLAQGFEDFYEPGFSAERRSIAMGLVQTFVYGYDECALDVRRGLRRWLHLRRDAERPLFTFVNLFEAHRLYKPPPRTVRGALGASRLTVERVVNTPEAELYVNGPSGATSRDEGWQILRKLYEAEISYCDEITGDLCDMLAPNGEARSNTLTIVTSDHGEDLGKGGLPEHQCSPYETSLHVPLVMVWPQRLVEGRRIRQRVCMRRIFATIGDAAGLSEQVYEGPGCRSILGLAEHGDSGARRSVVFAEVWPSSIIINEILVRYHFTAPLGRFAAPLLVVYDGDYKFIRAVGQNRGALYNLAEDPGETQDLSEEKPEVCRQMSAMLDHWLQATPNNMPSFKDGYDAQRLEARPNRFGFE